ncbi:MAG: type I-E CRISPR-associated protein Cas5/CasD [Thermomicrobium sp.]|nr:type I-E CRISPR-associated protein Cas5/CasD [Thermomicrobium sp.]MDW8006244.1 type I-E CRISPR-associated protein Cas5/CasD [Thermomicrobium sp.]
MVSRATLLLRLAGPLQSWGLQSRFTIRDTAREPTKSGVIGLLCAALGRSRDQNVDDLATLRMGVRVDVEGIMARDYQTVGGGSWPGREEYGVRSVGEKRQDTIVTVRYFLARAVFLVGLEGERMLLDELVGALRNPRWPLYLGRKSYVPSEPLLLPESPVRLLPLEDALRSVPWPISETVPCRLREKPPEVLRVVLEEPDLDRAERAQLDQPVGAAFRDRRFALRGLRTEFWRLGSDVPVAGR